MNKYKLICGLVKYTITCRDLRKTEVDKRIYERAIGFKKAKCFFSHRNNIKMSELPY